VDAGQHTNAIDIYVLPSNSQIQGGFVPSNNKKVMAIGGTKTVTHCSGGTTNYEIAQHRVVSHEMGHCFGLVHTWQYSGDDGLSDTPIDYVTNNGCVNPSTCQFVNNCGYSTCNVTSNPTSIMTNFMSYTVPTCMSVFTPMQIDLMRGSLNTSLLAVVSSSQAGPPNMQLMTYDSNQPVNTVNFVNSGWHNIYTNLNPSTLISNVTWSANTSYLYPTGTKLVNAGVVVNSGQSITVSITASNICGTANRNPTFVAYYGYSIYPNPVVGNSLSIKFDGSERIELLPQFISILDEITGQLELNVDVQNEKLNGNINQNILAINVAKIKGGIKLVKFSYKNLNSNDSDLKFTSTERIIIAK